MASREDILERIKNSKPEGIKLPNISTEVFDENLDLLKEFTKKVEVVGGTIYNTVSNEDVIKQTKGLFPETKVNFSVLKGTEFFNTVSLETIKRPHELEDLDILVLESDLGVAENGAIWLSDAQIPMRVLPFITKHLVLVLDKSAVTLFTSSLSKN